MQVFGVSLVVVFYLVFLAIFVLTAVVTIGGVLKWKPFRQMERKHVDRLFAALLLELVGAIVLTYKNLPPPGGTRVNIYDVNVLYSAYAEKWKSLLSTQDRGCLDTPTTTDSHCDQILSEYVAAQGVAGKSGHGRLYLIGDEIGAGTMSYTFPDEPYPVVLSATVERPSAGAMRLTLTQAARAVRGEAGVDVRAATTLVIDLKEEPNHVLRGLVPHPDVKDESGKPLAMGTVELLPSR